jgi:hypothetical protein
LLSFLSTSHSRILRGIVHHHLESKEKKGKKKVDRINDKRIDKAKSIPGWEPELVGSSSNCDLRAAI